MRTIESRVVAIGARREFIERWNCLDGDLGINCASVRQVFGRMEDVTLPTEPECLIVSMFLKKFKGFL